MRKYFFLFLFLLKINLGLADEQAFTNVFTEYKAGHYQDAINLLEKITDIESSKLALKDYWTGLCYSKLQQFDKAVIAYKSALRNKGVFEDLYYELGQALYATNDMEQARKSFALSAKKNNYKTDTSYYYVGHISQILEEYKNAKDYYDRVLDVPNADKKLLQVSRFQMAESMLSLADEKYKSDKDQIRPIVRKFILPQLEKAIKVDKDAEVVKEIEGRIAEIKKEYDLDPNYLKNGKKLPEKRYDLSLAQKVKYDSNVTLANDQPSTVASQKDSYVYETTAAGRYLYVIKNRYLVEPELRYTFTRYSDQDSPTVFTNDAYTVNPSIRTKYEHKLKDKDAAFLFDYDQTYTERDRLQLHDRIFYSRAQTFTFGERLKIFQGDSNIKLKFKDYNAYTDTLDSNTTSFNYDQTIINNLGHIVLILFIADYTRLVANTTSDTNSYLIRLDYIIPNFLERYLVDIAYSHTFLDTLEQYETRGTETTSTPSIKISQNFGNLKATIGYDYTSNSSLSTTYQYTKHETHFELKYSF
jgi:tetratricopeptide (TPR) repeat protein